MGVLGISYEYFSYLGNLEFSTSNLDFEKHFYPIVAYFFHMYTLFLPAIHNQKIKCAPCPEQKTHDF